MARSVVLAGTDRCPGCQIPPRWCICNALDPVVSPLRIDVLLHRREQWRPTSTGKLIGRALAGSRAHVFDRNRPLESSEVIDPTREFWILHPRGEPLPSDPLLRPDPKRIQVLLLDGSWNEAGQMLREFEAWGRPVGLPLAGSSRYWLREQQGEGHLSTVEALIGLFTALDLPDDAQRLQLHFELHVYASLRARGRLAEAARYLNTSPVRDALPHFLELLHERRPNPSLPRNPPRSVPPTDPPLFPVPPHP